MINWDMKTWTEEELRTAIRNAPSHINPSSTANMGVHIAKSAREELKRRKRAKDPRKCSHPKGHFVDNQGYCHCCGVPLNPDWIGLWTGDYEAAEKEVADYEKECSDYENKQTRRTNVGIFAVDPMVIPMSDGTTARQVCVKLVRELSPNRREEISLNLDNSCGGMETLRRGDIRLFFTGGTYPQLWVVHQEVTLDVFGKDDATGYDPADPDPDAWKKSFVIPLDLQIFTRALRWLNEED